MIASYILEEMECYKEADEIDSFIKTAANPDIKDWFANPIEFDQDIEKYNSSLFQSIYLDLPLRFLKESVQNPL